MCVMNFMIFVPNNVSIFDANCWNIDFNGVQYICFTDKNAFIHTHIYFRIIDLPTSMWSFALQHAKDSNVFYLNECEFNNQM